VSDDQPSTPSEAVALNKCPACLGRGRLFVVYLDAMGDCAACGGTGDLEDVWRRLDRGDR